MKAFVAALNLLAASALFAEAAAAKEGS